MQRNLRPRDGATRPSVGQDQGFVESRRHARCPPPRQRAPSSSSPRRSRPGWLHTTAAPQLFKQAAMIVAWTASSRSPAACTNEDLRADRQLRVHAARRRDRFVDQDDVLAFITEAVLRGRRGAPGDRPARSSITWQDAMERYGVRQARRPLRHGAGRGSRTCFVATEFNTFAVYRHIKGSGLAGSATRPRRARRPHRPGEAARRQGPRLVQGGRRRAGSRTVTKFLTDAEQAALSSTIDAKPGKVLVTWPASG